MFNATPITTTNTDNHHHQPPRTLPGREGRTLSKSVEDALKYANVPLSTWHIAARDAKTWNARIHGLNILQYEHAPDPSAAAADQGVQNAARKHAQRRTPSANQPTAEPTNPTSTTQVNNHHNHNIINNTVLGTDTNTDLVAQLLAKTQKTARESSPSRRSSRRLRGLSPTAD
jgi:hypothetical protein